MGTGDPPGVFTSLLDWAASLGASTYTWPPPTTTGPFGLGTVTPLRATIGLGSTMWPAALQGGIQGAIMEDPGDGPLTDADFEGYPEEEDFIKTWVAGEALTSADLNREFDKLRRAVSGL